MESHLAVIGAHPMDAEVLGGAIAAKLADYGCYSVLIHLTDGSGNYPWLGREQSSQLARREAKKAAHILGSKLCWLGFDSHELQTNGQVRDTLAERLMQWRPKVIITHWRGSWHERHRLAHRLVLNALARAGLSSTLYFGENFEDLAGFHPTHYIDITGSCARWWEALESYQLYRASRRISYEDHTTFPYYAYYHAMPRVRGLESGLPLAQALMIRGPRRHQPLTVADGDL